MKPEKKVVWERGVLMLPQHLQQLDRYQEALVAARIQAIEPNAWGVLEMRLDERALAEQKVVKLDRFQGILNDGTPVTVESPLALDGVEVPGGGGATAIYVAVPYEEPKVNNYAQGDDAFIRRYRVSVDELHDSAADKPRSDQLRLAMPHVQLMVEGSAQLERCARIKIAELRQGENGLVYDPSYIPPCIRVSASSALAGWITELRERAEYQLGVLLERRRFSADGRIEWDAVDVTRYLRLSAINSLLPALHYMERSADLPPAQVFLLLAQAVGQLATSSAAVDMRKPFDFDFLQLRETFVPLFDCAQRLLAETGERLYVQVNLEYRQGLFTASLDDPRMHGLSRYVLAMKSSAPSGEVIRDMETSAKISSPDVVRNVLMPNLPGTPVAAVPSYGQDSRTKLPVQIERQPGWLYFNLPAPDAGRGQWWEAIWAARQIGIWLPEKYQQAEIQLLGVLGNRPDA